MTTTTIGVTWKFIREGQIYNYIIIYLTKSVSETKRSFTTYILLYKIIYFLTLRRISKNLKIKI
jgi:hypothetical protein